MILQFRSFHTVMGGGYPKPEYLSRLSKDQLPYLGELWAIPIICDEHCSRNLSRVAARIAGDRNDTALANEWGNHIIEIAEENPKASWSLLRQTGAIQASLVSAFVAELTRGFNGKGGSNVTHNVDRTTSFRNGQQLNLMVSPKNQNPGGRSSSPWESINSLRFLAKRDWREFVESMIVEQTLREEHPAASMRYGFLYPDNYRLPLRNLRRTANFSDMKYAGCH